MNLYELAAGQGHVGAKEKLDYIYSHGLARRRSSMPSASQSAGDFNAVIAGDKVNIRSKPNTSSKIVKQLNAGEAVKATKQTKAKGEIWYFIQTMNGTQGWVFGKYVKLN